MANCPIHDYEPVTRLRGVGRKMRQQWALRGVTNIRTLRRALEKNIDLPGLTPALRQKVTQQIAESDALADANDVTMHRKPMDVPPPKEPDEPPPSIAADGGDEPFDSRMAPFLGREALGRFAWVPELRALTSPFRAARETFLRLFTPNMKLEGHLKGRALKPSVEASVKGWEARGDFLVNETDRIWSEYAVGLEPTPRGSTIPLRDRLRASRANIESKVGKSTKMDRVRFHQEVFRALGRGGRAADDVPTEVRPHVERAAKEMRENFFLPAFERRKQLGFESSLDENSYVPYYYDVERVMSDPDGFEAAVRRSVLRKIDASSLDDATKQQLRDTLEVRLPQWRHAIGETSYTRMADDFPDYIQANRANRERTLGKLVVGEGEEATIFRPDFEDIEPYLKTNISDVVHRYLRTQIVDMELKGEFGSLDLAKEIKRIELDGLAAITKARAEGNEVLARKLAARRNQDVQDIKNLVEVMRGTYKLPGDPYSLQGISARAANELRKWTFMRVGGGFGIASLSDVSSIAMEHGVKRTMGAFVAEFADGMAAIARAHSDKDFSALHLAFDDVLRRRSLDIFDVGDVGQDGLSKFEKATQRATTVYASITGLRPWTNLAKRVAARLVVDRMATAADEIARGVASSETVARFAAFGLEPPDARRLVELIPEHGGREDGLTWLGVQSWRPEDMGLARKIRDGLVRDVERLVVTPGKADVPTFIHTWYGATLLQFRRFGISHTNRVLIPALQSMKNGDLDVLHGMGLSIGMGATTYILREIVNKREVPTDIGDIIQQAAVRTDLWGAIGEMDGLTSAFTGGVISARGFIGPDTYYGGRFANDLAGTVLGPGIDTLGESSRAFRALFPFSESSERDIRALRRVMPLQNLFYFDWLNDAVENGLANMHTTARAARRAERDLEAVQ